jgi:hypothetical protein
MYPQYNNKKNIYAYLLWNCNQAIHAPLTMQGTSLTKHITIPRYWFLNLSSDPHSLLKPPLWSGVTN